ncbi:hypothetical protein EW146_g7030 [Bondarzewia mesenterica]|uniref:Uncharacterized protein n=1 Tax=Bondarzewia mesenterica TaxID=1095465 RepID=A0A4S4LM33_9AGAM|nr:hypothetical protein EW146_g7030 [Bondarzewia mesenterica]
MQSKIPWDMLKADTLRLVCRDLGATPGKRKRDDMIDFLKKVETHGLETAIAEMESEQQGKEKEKPTEKEKPATRTRAAAEEPLQTRSGKRTRPSGDAELTQGRPKRGKATTATPAELPPKRGGRQTIESVTVPASKRSGRGAKKMEAKAEERKEGGSGNKAPEKVNGGNVEASTSSPERQDLDALGEEDADAEAEDELPMDELVTQETVEATTVTVVESVAVEIAEVSV